VRASSPYNPQRDGRGGIEDGCSTCFTLLDLYHARLTLEAAHRDFVRKAAPWTQLRLKRAKPPSVDEDHKEQACQDDYSRGEPLPSPAPLRPQERHLTGDSMNRTESIVRNMLGAIEAPLYDVGVLSSRGMLPGLDGIPASAVLERLPLLKYRNARGSHIYIRPSGEHCFTVLDDLDEASIARLSADGFDPCAVVETSSGNFQAWPKHATLFPKLLGTFAAQTLASRYGADPSAADWRRFGRLPGFTNCKPKYRKPDGLFPFVRLKAHAGEQYIKAEAFEQEITQLYQAREQEREARRELASLSPQRGRRSSPSLERFRTSAKYQDRPAAADIAFCVAAIADGMIEEQIERALEDDYLSRDPSRSKRAAYIRRTIEKARRWAER